jgi:hypothetical protein
MRVVALIMFLPWLIIGCGTNDSSKLADCSIRYPETCDGFQDFAGCKLVIGESFNYEPQVTGSVLKFSPFNSDSRKALPPGLILDETSGVISGIPTASEDSRMSAGILGTCANGGTTSTTVSFVY